MTATLNDYGKLIVLLVALVGGFVMVIVGAVVKHEGLVVSGVAVIGPIVGYVTGNGVLAQRGKMPSPLLSSSEAVNLTPAHRTALLDLARTVVTDQDANAAAEGP